MSNGYRNGTRTVYQAGYEFAGETHWQSALYSSEESAKEAARETVTCLPTVKIVTKPIEIYR